MTKSIQSIDQEDERRRLSAILLKELVEEFRANGIKVSSTKDSITINGVRFELMDTPSDVHNEVIYIVSPDNQSIPVRKENYGEAIDVIMDYIETQGVGKSMEKYYVDSFDPNAFMDGVRQHMDEFDERPEYKRVRAMIDRWNNAESRSDTAIRGHMDDADEIRQPIRDWYTSAYPTDDLGHSMSDITFDDLYSGLSSGLDVYDKIGVGDSIVRERLFDRLAEIKRVTYNDIYNLWLNNARKGVRKSGKGLSKYVEGTIPLPDPIVLNADGKVYKIPSDPTYVGNASLRRAQIKMDDIIIIVDIRSMEPYFTFDYEVGAYYNNGWGTKLDNVAPYYGFNIPIEEGIATDFREIGDALDHVIQDYRMQAISGHHSDITRGMMKSKKLSKNSIDAMVDRIAFACQCDNPIVREINGDTILMMDVNDSDCEHYFDEYGIYQDEVDGKTYNCVNLSRLSKGVRKHRMLSKNKSYSIKDLAVGDVYESKGGVETLEIDEIRPEQGWVLGWYSTGNYGAEGDLEDVCWTIDEFNEWARINGVESLNKSKMLSKKKHKRMTSVKKSDSRIREISRIPFNIDGKTIYLSPSWESDYVQFIHYDDTGDFTVFIRIESDAPFTMLSYGIECKVSGYSYRYGGDVSTDSQFDSDFREIRDAIEHAVNDAKLGLMGSDNEPSYVYSESGVPMQQTGVAMYSPNGDGGWTDYYSKSTRKSVQSFSTMLDSIRKSANIGKAQLPDDYPNHSEGTFVVHRKVNYESMYPQRFDNREDYESFCRELENKGWTCGREYVDNDGAEVTYFRDTD